MSESIKDQFDVLSDVLDTLRFHGTIFFRSKLCAPWGMSLQRIKSPRFHIALSGECFVGTAEDRGHKIQASEIIILPAGDSHWIADQPGRELVPSAEAGRACELGNPLFQCGEVTHHLMCGLVQYDEQVSHPILDTLPSIMHFSMLEPSEPVWSTVRLLDAEMQRTGNNGGPIVDRLTEVLFLQLLNNYSDKNPLTSGFLAALRDRRIHQALLLIHKDPGYAWTLELLGARIGMSRATLIRHFRKAVGIPPMTYILNWRLSKAYNAVMYESTPIEDIAESVGFASARSLNKALLRRYDRTANKIRASREKRG